MCIYIDLFVCMYMLIFRVLMKFLNYFDEIFKFVAWKNYFAILLQH